MQFRDRVEAGQRLVPLVRQYQPDRPVVIGIPGGGVPVGLEVAAALDAPFEVWLGQKLGSPQHPSLGVGAIAEGDVVFLHPPLASGPDGRSLDARVARKQLELHARALRLRGGRPLPDVRGRTVLVVDDAVASGATMQAVLQALRSRKPRALVVAVPVGARNQLAQLRQVADRVHALDETPHRLAVGAGYDDFPQVPERLIREVLEHPSGHAGGLLKQATEALPADTRAIEIPAEGVALRGTLSVPEEARGLVILASPSATGRFSARRRFLATELRRRGLATLLLDLLTDDEELRALDAGEFRFELELLGRRLRAATQWIAHQPDTARMRVGCLDGPIGPGVALDAAARRPNGVQAVVSIGASPHVARNYVGRSKAPTLWLVGERDAAVLRLDPREIAEIFGEAELEIVSGAGSLFEEPFALEQVCALAGRWFVRQLIEQSAPAHAGLAQQPVRIAARPALSAGGDPGR